MVLALPLLALIAGAQTSPLEGCRAVLTGLGWQYTCPGLVLVVIDTSEVMAGQGRQVLEANIGTFMSRLGPGVRRSQERMKLGSNEYDVIRLDAAKARMYGAALTRAEGTRQLLCLANREPARCATVMDYLAGTAWLSGAAPGSLAQSAAPLELMGRPVSVPEGCKASPRANGGRIDCPPASFLKWTEHTDDSEAKATAASWFAGAKKQANDLNVRVMEDEVPCRLAGIPTACQRIRVDPDGAEAVTMLIARARTGAKIVVAGCAAPGNGEGKPCPVVLTVAK